MGAERRNSRRATGPAATRISKQQKRSTRALTASSRATALNDLRRATSPERVHAGRDRSPTSILNWYEAAHAPLDVAWRQMRSATCIALIVMLQPSGKLI